MGKKNTLILTSILALFILNFYSTAHSSPLGHAASFERDYAELVDLVEQKLNSDLRVLGIYENYKAAYENRASYQQLRQLCLSKYGPKMEEKPILSLDGLTIINYNEIVIRFYNLGFSDTEKCMFSALGSLSKAKAELEREIHGLATKSRRLSRKIFRRIDKLAAEHNKSKDYIVKQLVESFGVGTEALEKEYLDNIGLYSF